jgi:ferredoxin-NADP reductase
MEWTLPGQRVDNRGNRRYFTIASSPTEPDIKLGIKIPEQASSFKQQLVALEQAGSVVASQLAGDFTMPDDVTKKLVFIAGGIGVTPFRSMIQYLNDMQQQRDIVVLYTSSTADEFPYMEIFNAAQQLGVRTECCITKAGCAPPNWRGLVGRLSVDHLTKTVPDYKQRLFYLSGPNAMVQSYETLLHELGVSSQNIKKDYFPGF